MTSSRYERSYTRSILDDDTLEDMFADRTSENRTLFLLAILQNKNDVVKGVSDGGRDVNRAPIRANALAFFCDGRYWGMLQYCSVGTREYPEGVDIWIEKVANWGRAINVWAEMVATDEEVVLWLYEYGHLDTKGAWDEILNMPNPEYENLDVETILRDGIGDSVLSPGEWVLLYDCLKDSDWEWQRDLIYETGILNGNGTKYRFRLLYAALTAECEAMGLVYKGLVTVDGKKVFKELGEYNDG